MLCKLKNNGETLNIMLPENNSWLVSHTIKHPIKGYKEEGWNLYIDEDISEINENSSKVFEISDIYIVLLKMISTVLEMHPIHLVINQKKINLY